MITISLIRHGRTPGNEAQRYIGITDDPLSQAGTQALRAAAGSGRYPPVQSVYTSPLLRCRQTAGIVYPGLTPIPVPELAEYDFGPFENKTHGDLKRNPSYRRWIADRGMSGVPGGEDMKAFHVRCMRGFEKAVSDALTRDFAAIAVVAHGGTIMMLMSALTGTAAAYDFMTGNGEGFLIELPTGDKKNPVLWNGAVRASYQKITLQGDSPVWNNLQRI